jgi:hypothetical protein
MQRFAIVPIVLIVSGCIASNPVLHHDEWRRLGSKPKGAVVFALPQARFDVTYRLVRRTFTHGPHTGVVDYCLDPTYAQAHAVCAQLVALGVDKPLRLSDRKDNFTTEQFCRSDGGGVETRVGVADGSTLTPSMVPDPDQVYLVPLTRSYFQTFEVSLEINPNGTVGKGSLSTENLGVDKMMELIKNVALKFAHAAPPRDSPPPGPRPGYRGERPDAPTAAGLRSARGELAELAAVIRRRDRLVALDRDKGMASRVALIESLNVQIAQKKSRFIGKVSEKTSEPVHYAWIPGRNETFSSVSDAYDACGQIPMERTRYPVLSSSVSAEGLAPPASGTVDASDLPAARGWPYRIPREAMIGWAICPSLVETLGKNERPRNGEKWTDMGTSKCEPISGLRTLIPQLGSTLRLPAETGGRKSVVAPEYYADGSIKKVTASQTGTSPEPLIGAAQELLLPPPAPAPPSETVKLKAEADLINARQALCRLVFNVGEDDARCLGPNPATTLPSSADKES